MKTIFARMKGETPWFFMKIKALCVLFVAASAAGYDYELPGCIERMLPFIITAGISGFFVAQLTVKYPGELPDQANNKQAED